MCVFHIQSLPVHSPLKGESLHTRLHVHGHQFSMTSKFKIVKQICEVSLHVSVNHPSYATFV